MCFFRACIRPGHGWGAGHVLNDIGKSTQRTGYPESRTASLLTGIQRVTTKSCFWQGNAGLALILATAIAIGSLALLIRLKEQHLRYPLVGINPGR